MTLKPAAALTARVIEWDRAKGYGYLQFGGRRLFLHRRDFIRTRREPHVGDAIEFSVSEDVRGRAFAKNAVFADGKAWDSSRWKCLVVGTLVLLALPTIAAWRQGIPPRWMAAYILGVSGLTYWQYWDDKRRAQEGLWRVSEARLHLLELIGGWPGALIAQRRLRHESSKGTYVFVLWLIVILHQIAAWDSMQQWRWLHSAWIQIECFSQGANRRNQGSGLFTSQPQSGKPSSPAPAHPPRQTAEYRFPVGNRDCSRAVAKSAMISISQGF